MSYVSPQYLLQCRNDPLYWRNSLNVNRTHWGNIMSAVQRNDFLAIDPALMYLAGVRQEMPKIRKIFRQRSRGYSKSTDMASDLLWLMAFTTRRIKGFVAAADRDQARFIWDQANQLVFDNPWLADLVEIQKNKFISKATTSKIEFVTSDAGSSFGETPDIVVLDELTHWVTPGSKGEKAQMFFESCISSYGKRADEGAVLSVGCNAGFGIGFDWQLRERARTSPGWHFSAPPGSSPWYSDEMLEEQRGILSDNAFKRLYRNEWQDSGGTFVTIDEAKACVDPKLTKKSRPDQDVYAYVAAIDYAEKVDRTVGVLLHREGPNLIVDRMDVIDPDHTATGVTSVYWCENWLEWVYNTFGTGEDAHGRPRELHVVIDKTQLLWLLEKYQYKYDNLVISPFAFAAGQGNYELASMLRNAVLHKTVRWYPDCGVILDQFGNPVSKPGMDPEDLCTELSSVTVKEMSGGKWRITHNPGQHDDRTFALGAATLYVRQNDLSDVRNQDG